MYNDIYGVKTVFGFEVNDTYISIYLRQNKKTLFLLYICVTKVTYSLYIIYGRTTIFITEYIIHK